VTAWGMNVLKLPPDWMGYPEHDHARDGQEEVYVVLRGSARLEAGGKSWQLEPGMLVRVGSEQRRKLVPGSDGVTLLALGGTPGKAYESPSRTRRA
jgi:mannose-6-phosphate isomerase-like protein (cupin superfamily)